MEIKAGRADSLYQQVLTHLVTYGNPVSPRGDRTLETVGVLLKLSNPYRNIITLRDRQVSYPFMVAEWLWMLLGMNDLDMIVPYNKIIQQFSDDGETLSGAYGPKLVEQLPYVLRTLRADPSSRQAVITIWRERPGPSKDIPCTVAMQFLVRDVGGVKTLDMLVYMRSNDAWLGLPYDLFSFTMIQQYVASVLDVVCGNYHHMVGSLHLYERNYQQAMAVVASEDTYMNPMRDHVTEHMDAMSPMPHEFRSMFMGLTLMAKHAETKQELKSWLNMMDTMPAPWSSLLSVLGYRFHEDRALLQAPWDQLIREKP